MAFCDLHSHSTVSDGKLSPTELVQRAHAQGVAVLALTDHDNVGGLPEARLKAAELGMSLVNGVEISADFEPGTMHILGLGLDDGHAALLEKLDWLQEARRTRNPQIIQKLQQAGVSVTLEDVAKLAGDKQIGRPHFAQALIDAGVVGTFQEAFDRYLAKGALAYMPKARLSPADSIAAIHAAGGKAVLAHPIQLKLADEALEACVAELRALGLDGIEVWHSDHAPEDELRYLALAARHRLRVSGGSDYHGIQGKDIELGRPRVDAQVAGLLLNGAFQCI